MLLQQQHPQHHLYHCTRNHYVPTTKGEKGWFVCASNEELTKNLDVLCQKDAANNKKGHVAAAKPTSPRKPSKQMFSYWEKKGYKNLLSEENQYSILI